MAYINGNHVLYNAQINGLVNIDAELSKESENPIQNKAVAKALEDLTISGGGVVVDSELSTESTNPVENRVVTEAINYTALEREEINNTISAVSDSLTELADNRVVQLESRVTDIETNKADKENGFTIIQSVTVEEAEVHAVEFTNLNLEKAYLFASFPADTEKKIVGGRVYLYGGYHLMNFYTAEAISTSAKYFHVFAEKNNGVWNNIWKKSSTKNDLNNIGSRSCVDHSELWLNENYKYNIERVSISAGDSDKTVYFPIGTKIYLCGVVAE